LFTSAIDRTAYEEVWRNLFYRTLEELPEAKCNKEQLMRMQPQAQLERLRAVHPKESSKDAFILAFNALPQEERLSRYRPLQAFLDFWPRLGFTWLAASLCDLYYFLHYTCNHLIIENQALEFSVSTLVKRYAQVNPVVGKYLQNIYQNDIVKPYNRYVDFCNGRIGYQCDDQNKFEKISDDQKIYHFLSFTHSEDEDETGDWAYRVIRILLNDHNDFLANAGVTDAVEVHPAQLSFNTKALLAHMTPEHSRSITSYILHARLEDHSWDFERVQREVMRRLCWAKARFDPSLLRSKFCFRQEKRDSRDGAEDQSADETGDGLIDTIQMEFMRDVLPSNLQHALQPYEELTWRQFLQGCSFKQISGIAHHLQLLANVMTSHAKSGDLNQLPAVSVVAFAEQNGQGTGESHLAMQTHHDLSNMPMKKLLAMLEATYESIRHGDHLFFDLNKKLRQPLPEHLWQQLLSTMNQSPELISALEDDLASFDDGWLANMEPNMSLKDFLTLAMGSDEFVYKDLLPGLECRHYTDLRLRLRRERRHREQRKEVNQSGCNGGDSNARGSRRPAPAVVWQDGGILEIGPEGITTKGSLMNDNTRSNLLWYELPSFSHVEGTTCSSSLATEAVNLAQPDTAGAEILNNKASEQPEDIPFGEDPVHGDVFSFLLENHQEYAAGKDNVLGLEGDEYFCELHEESCVLSDGLSVGEKLGQESTFHFVLAAEELQEKGDQLDESEPGQEKSDVKRYPENEPRKRRKKRRKRKRRKRRRRRRRGMTIGRRKLRRRGRGVVRRRQ